MWNLPCSTHVLQIYDDDDDNDHDDYDDYDDWLIAADWVWWRWLVFCKVHAKQVGARICGQERKACNVFNYSKVVFWELVIAYILLWPQGHCPDPCVHTCEEVLLKCVSRLLSLSWVKASCPADNRNSSLCKQHLITSLNPLSFY